MKNKMKNWISENSFNLFLLFKFWTQNLVIFSCGFYIKSSEWLVELI